MWKIADIFIRSYFKLIKISMHRLRAIKCIIESITEKPLK